jgi:hypothetical protein
VARYIHGYGRAREVFRHQRVYDPASRTVLPLTPVSVATPEGGMPHCGAEIADEIAVRTNPPRPRTGVPRPRAAHCLNHSAAPPDPSSNHDLQPPGAAVCPRRHPPEEPRAFLTRASFIGLVRRSGPRVLVRSLTDMSRNPCD